MSPAAAGDGYLDVRGATVRYGAAAAPVLDGLDVSVAHGEFVSLLGPSGCGKTTLLRLVAGLIEGQRGTVALGGRDLSRLPAHRRNIGVVFQNYALFPHLDVRGNVAFGLRARGRPRAEIDAAVRRALELVRLTDFADRRVQALSGGQQQRVAVARALAVDPDLVLFDEPFSALDRKLREDMQIELKQLLRRMAVTAVFVTHDQDEALVMSDRIAVMNRGEIEQFASPAAIYDRPATPFVLGFVGSSTQLQGKVVSSAAGRVVAETAAGPIAAPARFLPGSPVIVAVRPERISLGEGGEGRNTIAARLVESVFAGARTTLRFATEDGAPVLSELDRARATDLVPGGRYVLSWAEADTLCFPG